VSFLVRLATVIVMGFVALSVSGLAPGRSPWGVHVRPDMRPKTLQRLLEDALGALMRSAPDIHAGGGGRGRRRRARGRDPESPSHRLELADNILEALSQATGARFG
jgi:hypothetical protein